MQTKLTLESILVSRYGVTLLNTDPISIEWAAFHLAEKTDADTAGKAWRKANAKRERHGMYAPRPAWGTPLYAAYYGAE